MNLDVIKMHGTTIKKTVIHISGNAFSKRTCRFHGAKFGRKSLLLEIVLRWHVFMKLGY